MANPIPTHPLITMYSSLSNAELMEIDPHDLVTADLIGNLEMWLQELRRHFPVTLAAMQAGDLGEEAEENLDSNGERLYAF